MTGSPTADTQPFNTAAVPVIRRLWLRKTVQHLVKTLPWAVAVLVLLMVLRALGLFGGGMAVALPVVAAWFAGCAALAWWQRPDAYGAFAFWDSCASRGDAFANAWWFEHDGVGDDGRRLHWSTQAGVLPQAMKMLHRDIALPDMRWLAAMPLLLVALFMIPGGSGLTLPDAKLTDEGRELAKQEGRKLAEKKLDAEKMKALSEEEKKELAQLQQKVQETAQTLEQRTADSAREVLSELEKRARDAEKLAEKLGAGTTAWASEQMIAEMRKHADTAELGDAAASRSTENAAKEAQKLADELRDPKLTNETRDRMAESLKDIGKQAQPEDKERLVGQHMIGADRDLSQSLSKEAGDEFQKLADKMRTLAAREKAREELEKLAQQLRESGSSIAGQGSKGMQQLAGNQGQTGQQGQNQQGGQGQQQMMTMQNAPQMQPMQVPGLSNAPQGGQQGQQGAGQQMQMTAPVPGTGQKPGNNQALVPGGGSGQNQGNKPMLIAPIPGTNPNQQPNAAILGLANGGSKAGNGTTDLGNSPTAKTKSGQDATVNAQRGTEGESTVRAVEGQTHNEQASRAAQATALQTITAEENALDDAALPAARREQVRRYFTELRKRFEKEK